MSKKRTHLIIDLFFVVLSILFAIYLIKKVPFDYISFIADHSLFLASFFAGIFFTSAFTIAPSAVILGSLSLQSGEYMIVAFGGAFGALIGDLLIYFFIKDRLAEDIMNLLGRNRSRKFRNIFHYKFFRFITPFVGALIIASPLPDELGLAMMGLSKVRLALLIPISYSMNFIGVLIVALAVQGF